LNDPEADYQRLRTEWLRRESRLDVGQLLEVQRGVEVGQGRLFHTEGH
jgi:hypothetical protein